MWGYSLGRGGCGVWGWRVGRGGGHGRAVSGCVGGRRRAATNAARGARTRHPTHPQPPDYAVIHSATQSPSPRPPPPSLLTPLHVSPSPPPPPGSLTAGAMMPGEFEDRLKAVLQVCGGGSGGSGVGGGERV
mgnify:CR=1 FL=1